MVDRSWLSIASDHPDRDAPLLRALADALHGAGADVVVRAGDENLVRGRRADEPAGPPFRVIVEGLPNLLHEFVHVVQAGVVADDHGIDYGQIPFDVTTSRGRALLWDELACCVISCAYLPRARAVEWFAEQVGIQGAFFGLGDLEVDLAPFVALVEGARAAHPGELEAVLERAYAEVHARLTAFADDDVACPAVMWSFDDLWGNLRESV